MTCEVAVMNKRGVALAADSAVTLGDGGKIYHTAEKLFALAPDLPVAIMTFGEADIMSVPWETVVTVYGRKLSGRRFDTLEQYAQDFLGFIERASWLFPIDQEAARVSDLMHGAWKTLYAEPLADRLEEEDGLDPIGTLSEIIAADQKLWERYDDLEGLGVSWGKQATALHEETLLRTEKEVFSGLRLPARVRAQLRHTAALMFGKRCFYPSEECNLVVAGIGEAEAFPVLVRYSVGPIVAGRLRSAKVDDARVGGEGPEAIIVPLAQREIIDLIIDGIHPALRAKLIKDVGQREPGKVAKGKENTKEAFSDLIESESLESHGRPFMKAVSALPRQDLARLAESLVDLTAFMLRMDADSRETVGGPIDVAILSKADGFTWVKQKQLAGR